MDDDGVLRQGAAIIFCGTQEQVWQSRGCVIGGVWGEAVEIGEVIVIVMVVMTMMDDV